MIVLVLNHHHFPIVLIVGPRSTYRCEVFGRSNRLEHHMEHTEGFSLVIWDRPWSEHILAHGTNSWPLSTIQPVSPQTNVADLIKFNTSHALEGLSLYDPELITMRLSRQHSHTASPKWQRMAHSPCQTCSLYFDVGFV